MRFFLPGAAAVVSEATTTRSQGVFRRQPGWIRSAFGIEFVGRRVKEPPCLHGSSAQLAPAPGLELDAFDAVLHDARQRGDLRNPYFRVGIRTPTQRMPSGTPDG